MVLNVDGSSPSGHPLETSPKGNVFFVQQKRHRKSDGSFYSVGFRYQRTVQLSFSPGAKAVYAPWFSISI